MFSTEPLQVMSSTAVKKCLVLTCLIPILLSAQCLSNLTGSLQNDVMLRFDINISEFGLLTSVINWAALIDIVHGYLLDRYLNIRTATIIYSSILIIGTICICVAAFTKHFWLFLLGRILSGFGTNPLVLCTNKHIIYWFSGGRYINLVYSISESTSWLGTSSSYFISIRVYEYVKEYYSSFDSLALTLCSEVIVFGFLPILSSTILALLYGKMKTPGTPDDSQSISENGICKGDKREDSLTWKDYVSLSWLFWIFSITVFIYFTSALSFLSMSQLYFKTRYNVSTSYANTLTGFITVTPFALAPPFGIFLDKFGYNLTCFTLAFILNILSTSLFTFSDVNAIVPVGVMAISLVLSSSLWSQFQYLVESHQYMIAYGVAQTGLNGALAVGAVTAGYIIKRTGYDGFMNYLVAVMTCTLPALTLIWYLNYKSGNILNLEPRKKLEYIGRSDDSKKDSDK